MIVLQPIEQLHCCILLKISLTTIITVAALGEHGPVDLMYNIITIKQCLMIITQYLYGADASP